MKASPTAPPVETNPEKPFGRFRRERKLFVALDVPRCVAFETAIVLNCANRLRAGESLSIVDHARLVTASGRLDGALGFATGAEMAAASDRIAKALAMGRRGRRVGATVLIVERSR